MKFGEHIGLFSNLAYIFTEWTNIQWECSRPTSRWQENEKQCKKDYSANDAK